MMKNWWISWYGKNGSFELYSPWWISGEDLEDRFVFCAAVKAIDENSAKRVILDAYDKGSSPDGWRFVDPCEDTWSPFCDRFPKADWMRWIAVGDRQVWSTASCDTIKGPCACGVWH